MLSIPTSYMITKSIVDLLTRHMLKQLHMNMPFRPTFSDQDTVQVLLLTRLHQDPVVEHHILVQK